MNRRIRWVGAVLLVCFVVLFVQLNNFQLRQATSVLKHHNTVGCDPNPFALPRGDIISADGSVLAYSVPTKDGYGELRVYPSQTAALFADLTGYASVTACDATGLEAEYNSSLEQHYTSVDSLGELFTQHKVVDDIHLNVSVSLQQIASTALATAEFEQGGDTGAVVALDPRTGAILAMYGLPTFNPNELVVHSSKELQDNYNAIVKQAGCNGGGTSPLNNAATSCSYPPGSTFKTIDSTAIFDYKPLLALKFWPPTSSIPLPDSNQHLQNFDGEYCPAGGGYLPQILAYSCDTAFAQVGMTLGAIDLNAQATTFGFNAVPPIDLPSGEVAASSFPSVAQLAPGGSLGTPGLAYSAIGQENVSATALQMALVAAGIANNGVIMTPHLLDDITDQAGIVLSTYQPHPWRRVTTAARAAEVRKLMTGVTSYGTATGVFTGSFTVAAKTGTAETVGCATDNWLIAMAPAGTNQTPTAVVAVVVPTPPNPAACAKASETTGAAVAGPVANTVLNAVIAQQAQQAADAAGSAQSTPNSTTTTTRP